MRALEGTERVDGTTALVSVVLGQKLYVANGERANGWVAYI